MSLEEAQARFASARARFTPSAAHLVPDIALVGFVRDVDENARAAGLLAGSELPHRAYPNTRAVFEASQRAVLLATAEDFDLEGAKAWVYSLSRDRGYMALPRLIPNPRAPKDPEAWFMGSLDEMAAAWEAVAAGKGLLLRQALEQLPRRKGRQPDNWMGTPLSKAMRDRLNSLLVKGGKPSREGTDLSYAAAYAALCRQTHPNARLELVQVRGAPNGKVALDEAPRDPAADAKSIRLSLAGSVVEAALAINIRVDRFG